MSKSNWYNRAPVIGGIFAITLFVSANAQAEGQLAICVQGSGDADVLRFFKPNDMLKWIDFGKIYMDRKNVLQCVADIGPLAPFEPITAKIFTQAGNDLVWISDASDAISDLARAGVYERKKLDSGWALQYKRSAAYVIEQCDGQCTFKSVGAYTDLNWVVLWSGAAQQIRVEDFTSWTTEPIKNSRGNLTLDGKLVDSIMPGRYRITSYKHSCADGSDPKNVCRAPGSERLDVSLQEYK